MRTEFGPGRYGIPQHGKLKFGYFYRVSFENADRHGLAPQDLEQDLQTRLPHEWLESSILVTASYLSNEEWEAFRADESNRFAWTKEERQKLGCSLNAEHDLEWLRATRGHLQIWEQRKQEDIRKHGKNPVLMDTVVSRSLADRMVQVGITGARFEPVTISRLCNAYGATWPEETKTLAFDTDVVELQFVGKPCHRKREFFDTADACPFCGFGPLTCGECGHLTSTCPQCGDYVFKANDVGKPGHKSLAWEFARPIIEGKLWDGADLICGRGYLGGFATRRFVEWLISIHAAPLHCTRVAVCVDGMSEAQLKHLERSRDVGTLTG